MVGNDDMTEFKSRWKYSFNISEPQDIIIGLHQKQFLFSGINRNFFIGLVLLKSNNGMYAYVDYINLSDGYNNYLQVKLDIGSYIVIPM